MGCSVNFGVHTFVPLSWACKKQTAVSHCSTGAEVIFLDSGWRLEGLPALALWYTGIDVLEPPASRARGDRSRPTQTQNTDKPDRNPVDKATTKRSRFRSHIVQHRFSLSLGSPNQAVNDSR